MVERKRNTSGGIVSGGTHVYTALESSLESFFFWKSAIFTRSMHLSTKARAGHLGGPIGK
jgi:hypothetical protein